VTESLTQPPLRDILEKVKKELLEAREELERAKEYVGSQRHALEKEGAELEKVRADLSSTLQMVRQKIAEFVASMRELEQPGEKLHSWAKELTDLADNALGEIESERKELLDTAMKLKLNLDNVTEQRHSLEEQLSSLRTERESRAASQLAGVCPACGRNVRPDDTFCDECGTSLV